MILMKGSSREQFLIAFIERYSNVKRLLLVVIVDRHCRSKNVVISRNHLS